MGFYSKYILPKLIDIACSASTVAKQRVKVVPGAKGKILEIGLGTGLNLPFYKADQVESLWGLEPVRSMLDTAERKAKDIPFPLHLLEATAEEIPLDSNSMDSIVITYTLCSIPDVPLALAEIRRVLKPDGQLLFCEHGAAPDPEVLKWQDRITPMWKRFGGGCHLNRRIPELLEAGDLVLQELQTMYIPGWRPACFNYWGKATLK